MYVLRTLGWLGMLLAFHVSSISMEKDEDDWIDPYDMLNFDHSSVKMTGKSIHENHDMPEKEEIKGQQDRGEKTTLSEGSVSEESGDKTEDRESVKGKIPKEPEAADKGDTSTVSSKTTQKLPENSSIYKTLYRKHVKMLVDKWESEAVLGESALNFVMAFSLGNLKLLRKFADSGEGNIHEIEDILQRMVVHVQPPVGLNYNSGFLEGYIGISLRTIIQILAVLALVSVIMWIELTLQISWRQKIIKLIVLSFFISIPWTWYHMYKQEEAKRQSELMKDIPEVCVKRKLSWYEMAAEVTRSMFTLSDDQCVKYYEQMLVDPVWKVAPTEAIAVTFVRFFLSPAKHVGQALSEFVKGTFQHLPVTLWPIMLVCGMILIILILLFSFGYSIRLPLLLSIESSNSSVSKHRLEIMTSENTQHKKQIEELKEKLKEVEGDRLRLTYSLTASLQPTHSDSSLQSIIKSQNAIRTSQNHQTRISSSDHTVQSGDGLFSSRVQSIQPDYLVHEQEASKSITYVKQDDPLPDRIGQKQNVDVQIKKQDMRQQNVGNGLPENEGTVKHSGDVNNINPSVNVDCVLANPQNMIYKETAQSCNAKPETNRAPSSLQELKGTLDNGQSWQNINGVNTYNESVQKTPVVSHTSVPTETVVFNDQSVNSG